MTRPVTVSSVFQVSGLAHHDRETRKGVTHMSTTAVQGPDDVLEVVLGVDTHLDVHVAAVLSELAVPTTKRGYHSLLSWAEGFACSSP